MTKQILLDNIKKAGSYSSRDTADHALRSVIKAISNALIANDDVSIQGFGSFKSVTQAAKSGTVPGTTKKYQTVAKQVPRFVASSVLKQKLANGK